MTGMLSPATRPDGRPRLVMLTSVLPSSPADNAGGRYLGWVLDAVSDIFEVLVVAPDGDASRRAAISGQVPPHRLIERDSAPPGGGGGRLLERFMAFVMPVHLSRRYIKNLLRDPVVADAIRRADVIDLQWQEHGTLIPLLRKLNSNAKIVCTFHDVLSQRFRRARDSAASPLRRFRWEWATWAALRVEEKICEQADKAVVLSDKDARLLPKVLNRTAVVNPPVALEMGSIDRSSPMTDHVLFVAFLARWENEEGLLWFLSDVWPLVTAVVPYARFQIAGEGIRPNVRAAADRAGVELLGFVPDVEVLYERAAVVVVPLRLGAGVKFKVIDALAAGVPVVTTSVGAEGIGDASWFAGLHDDAEDFANALIAVLQGPEAAAARSSDIQRRVNDVYGWEQFVEAISQVYLEPTQNENPLRRGEH